MTETEEITPESQLESTLKVSLEEVVALARRKIRSKKGLADLQTLLIDYHENTQLASIVLNVIRLVSAFEARKDQPQQQKEGVSLEEYKNLESALQRHEASVRQHIRNQQQLKIYCDEIEARNKQLETNNLQLLRSTKAMITNLKRENQKLAEMNRKLVQQVKEQQGSGAGGNEPKFERSGGDSVLERSGDARSASRKSIRSRGEMGQDAGGGIVKSKRHSLSSLRTSR